MSATVDGEGEWNGGVILQAWIDRFPELGKKLSSRERGRLGAACKRLAEGHTREDVAVAFVGMAALFPHNEPKNEPWDPMTLEEKFPRALMAAANHPKVKQRREERSLREALEARKAGGFRA